MPETRRVYGGIVAPMMHLCIALLLCAQALTPVSSAAISSPTRARSSAAQANSPTHLFVTTTADLVNGNVASFVALAADPGADGAISLREAITAANGTPPGTDLTISFAIPPGDPGYDDDVSTIRISAAANLPDLARGNLTIDGSAPDSGLPSIALDGGANLEVDDGLVIASAENVVRGLIVRNFFYSGIYLLGDGVTGNRIEGCVVEGVGLAGAGIWLQGSGVSDNVVVGSTIRDNIGFGVQIDEGARDNRIGGTTAAERNLISGNELGVFITGADTQFNVVSGNWIGTDLLGSGPYPNATNGVLISGGAHDNTVGGTGPGAGNVISGNVTGISITGASSNTIVRNLIGLTPDGQEPLPNQDSGIILSAGARSNRIGLPGAGNVISSNGAPGTAYGHGIYIADPGSDGNRVQGNYVGVDSSGNRAGFGNYRYGILILTNAKNNIIGGIEPNAANVIAYNGFGGLRVDTDGNQIVGNRIGVGANGTTPLGNQRFGVRLGGSGNKLGPGNVIAYSHHGGVLVAGSSTDVFSNTIRSNARTGVCVSQPGASVTGNLITANGGASSALNECPISAGLVITATFDTYVGHNTIQANIGAGVTVSGGSRNRLIGNSITENSDIGIRLSNGGNDGVPPPVINAVTDGGIGGSACAGCRVEVFSDAADQGAYFVGRADAEEDGTFRIQVTRSLLPGKNITATSTDADGNTSPFAFPVPLEGGAVGRPVYIPLATR